jgi:site-specific DNA recombinase
VRAVYQLYTEKLLSIGEIVRRLNAQGIPTRKGKSPWERTTVWGILRNPAYKGTACFGKTQMIERKKITRPLRKKGGFSSRCSSNCERPRHEWIEIPVPAIVSEETFALAQERLAKNKQLSSRSTKEPTLLQGILVCSQCGYAFYRTSTRTSKRKLYYYRCLGSDDYRYPNGRVCANRPIRQDYLDALVWERMLHMLQDPELIRMEIERRIHETQQASPAKRRKDALLKEKVRLEKATDKLLDAYQEDLLPLSELRKRIPALRKRLSALVSELQSLELRAVDQEKFLTLSENIEGFLAHMRKSAQTLNVKDRQRILRLLVKEILVGPDTITIKHSIPTGKTFSPSEAPGYLLCKRSHTTTLWRSFLHLP